MALEDVETILALDDVPTKAGLVRELLAKRDVFAIGRSVDEGNSDLLSVPFDDPQEGRLDLVPVFTSLELAEEARLRRPEWQTMDILQVRGGDLVNDADITVVVNPLSRLELRLPRIRHIQHA